MDKIACARGRRILAALSPTDRAIALEHIGDGLLLAVMMNAGLSPGLGDKDPAPKSGCDTIVDCDGGATLGPRRLSRSSFELGGLDDANRAVLAHKESF